MVKIRDIIINPRGLPSQGALSMSQIKGEFNKGNTFSSYYGATSGIPAGPPMSISDFYGKGGAPENGAGSGGTESDEGGYRYHIYTSNGTFTVTKPGLVDILVCGGGAGGAGVMGGGGGGGAATIYAATNLVNTGDMQVVVGYGGLGQYAEWSDQDGPVLAVGQDGGASSISGANNTARTAAGGKGGINRYGEMFGLPQANGGASGSGQAGGEDNWHYDSDATGGGGGATGAGGKGVLRRGGGPSQQDVYTGGAGGVGLTLSGWHSSIFKELGGGGGGSATANNWMDFPGTAIAGRGWGGGGNGSNLRGTDAGIVNQASSGSSNTGGGGGGGGNNQGILPRKGGSGIVVVRYPI